MLSNEGYQRMEQTLQWRVDIERTMIWQWRDMCVNYSQHITFSRDDIIGICILLQTENCIINHVHTEYAKLQSAQELHQKTYGMSFIYNLFYNSNEPGPIVSVLNSPYFAVFFNMQCCCSCWCQFPQIMRAYSKGIWGIILIMGTKIFLWCSDSKTVTNVGIWHMCWF